MLWQHCVLYWEECQIPTLIQLIYIQVEMDGVSGAPALGFEDVDSDSESPAEISFFFAPGLAGFEVCTTSPRPGPEAPAQ